MGRQIFRANGVLINIKRVFWWHDIVALIHVASPLSVQACVAISRKKAAERTLSMRKRVSNV